MSASENVSELRRRLAEAEATIHALLSGQIDAVVDAKNQSPVLLSKAQDALRESEERYRQIVEATSDGIIQVDSSCMIEFVNRRFREMLGYESREMIGVSALAFMSSASRAMAASSIRAKPIVTGALDVVFRHKTGVDISVNMVGTDLFDTDGQYTGNLLVLRDVTEQKKLQFQLMASDRMASVGTLAAGVAHEINNPLAAVLVNLGFIADSVSQLTTSASAGSDDRLLLDELRVPLDDAREGARRVRLIVRDLKIFSRSPSEEANGPVDVQAVMESSLRMAWNEVRHRARLVKNYTPVPFVDVNEARLGQVFLNLLVNAVQALQEGEAEQNEIRVSTRQETDQVIMEVADTGPGIAPEIIGRIFDPFFTTKAIGVGTGLGLAICQRIVSDMNGELTVSSELGRGTTFRIALPVSHGAVKEGPRPISHSPISVRRGQVLVVDDEEPMVRVVQRVLSKEHDVVGTVSAVEALAMCASGRHFDLILCDLMMPDMTGMDLHRELTRVAPEQANRMIFLTGGAFTEKARQFLSMTAMEHIEKPFDAANLRAIVQRYLRS